MKVRWFAPTILFLVVLGGQSIHPSLAYAWCCPCSCMPQCTCAGKFDQAQRIWCPHCFSTDTAFMTFASKNVDQPSVLVGSGVPSLARSIKIQQTIDMRMVQPCLRDKFALNLLGNNKDILKFDFTYFEDKSAGNQIVALQIEQNPGD